MKTATPFIDARARQTSRIARGWFRMMNFSTVGNFKPASPAADSKPKSAVEPFSK